VVLATPTPVSNVRLVGGVQLELTTLKKQMKRLEAALVKATMDDSVHIAPHVKGVENKRGSSE
jgi:hypothetical protein